MRSRVVAAFLVALAVATCAQATDTSPTATPEVDATAPWGPLAVVRSSGNGDAALTGGVLEIGAHCVFVTAANQRTLLAWPDARTRWDAASSTIVYVQFDGTVTRLRHGERWGFGGSGGAAAGVIPRLDWVAPPSPECAAQEIWLVGEVVPAGR